MKVKDKLLIVERDTNKKKSSIDKCTHRYDNTETEAEHAHIPEGECEANRARKIDTITWSIDREREGGR